MVILKNFSSSYTLRQGTSIKQINLKIIQNQQKLHCMSLGFVIFTNEMCDHGFNRFFLRGSQSTKRLFGYVKSLDQSCARLY